MAVYITSEGEWYHCWDIQQISVLTEDTSARVWVSFGTAACNGCSSRCSFATVTAGCAGWGGGGGGGGGSATGWGGGGGGGGGGGTGSSAPAIGIDIPVNRNNIHRYSVHVHSNYTVHSGLVSLELMEQVNHSQ